jgi:phosphoenolpyruvate-protein kinase (PTS system EI component)
MCGELAGNPALAKLLLGLGARRFSVSQANYVDTLTLIRGANVHDLEEKAALALASRTKKAVRSLRLS